MKEALHLADRIVILSDRPARIRCIIPITFPHPRSRMRLEIAELENDILRELGVNIDDDVLSELILTVFPRTKRTAAPQGYAVSQHSGESRVLEDSEPLARPDFKGPKLNRIAHRTRGRSLSSLSPSRW